MKKLNEEKLLLSEKLEAVLNELDQGQIANKLKINELEK